MLIDEEANSKALHEFIKVVHNGYTQKSYMAHLRKYQKWSNLSFDDLVNRDNEIIQAELEKYVEFLQANEGHSNAYLRLGLAGITLFYAMNNKIINKVRLSKMLWPEKHLTHLQAYTTFDIQTMLESIGQNKLKKHPKYRLTRLRLKAIIHFLAASGCRVGGMTFLKVKDLTRIENCYTVTVYADSKYEYVTFLTPEATIVLDEWLDFIKAHLKRFTDKGLVMDFEDYPLFDLEHDSIYTAIQRVVRKSNLEYEKEGKRYPKPINHAFRYRFNTIAKSNKDVNPVLVERLLGHSTSIALDKHYLKPTTQELFTEYKKLIKDLSIY